MKGMLHAGPEGGPSEAGACGMAAEKGEHDATAAEPPGAPGGLTSIEPATLRSPVEPEPPIGNADGDRHEATDSEDQRNGRLGRLLGIDDAMDGTTTHALQVLSTV